MKNIKRFEKKIDKNIKIRKMKPFMSMVSNSFFEKDKHKPHHPSYWTRTERQSSPERRRRPHPPVDRLRVQPKTINSSIQIGSIAQSINQSINRSIDRSIDPSTAVPLHGSTSCYIQYLNHRLPGIRATYDRAVDI